MIGRGGWGETGQDYGMMRRRPGIGFMVDGRLAHLKEEFGINDAQAAA
jgi:hypothetical protein